jgi:hypothetical protein
MATAGKLARSVPSLATAGAEYVAPLSVERITNARSLFVPARSSDQLTSTSSVASAPVGAPLATSMLGKTLVRAPAMPSIVNRPCAGSNWPIPATVTIARGRSNAAPPLKDRAWNSTSWRVRTSVPLQTTYTTPALSVRTAQPCRPPVCPLLVAALS